MKYVLAVDTSQIQAIVCLFEYESQNFRLIRSKTGSTSVAHSESLLALIDSVLKDENKTPNDIDYFACGVGPGSFTGLRIGCVTQKTFAQALNKKMMAFSSLQAVYFSHEAHPRSDCVVMVNAYQGQVFSGWWDKDLKTWNEACISKEEWFSEDSERQNYTLIAPGSFIQENGVLSCLNQGVKEQSVYDIKLNYLKVSSAEAKLEKHGPSGTAY